MQRRPSGWRVPPRWSLSCIGSLPAAGVPATFSAICNNLNCLGYNFGCAASQMLLHSSCSTNHFNGCFPSQPLSFGGLVRLIRPLNVARLLAVLFAVGVAFPSAPAEAAAQKKKPAVRRAAYNPATSQVRKARLARARMAARAREHARFRALQEAMTPRYKTDASGALVPDVRAAAAIIFNPETGQVLWEENAQDKRSIASITKVMTAVVFLEDNPDLSQEVTVERSDVYAASTTYLRANDRITPRQPAAPHADRVRQRRGPRARARLARRDASFVERMNEKALELGLESTSFADPSGLNPANVSSAYDLSRLISFAAADERIAPDHADARPTRSRPTAARSSIHSTNHLVRERRRRRDGRQDRLHHQGRLLPGDAAAPAAEPASRSRSSCSARARTTAASGRRATCSTGSPTRRPTSLRRTRRRIRTEWKLAPNRRVRTTNRPSAHADGLYL